MKTPKPLSKYFHYVNKIYRGITRKYNYGISHAVYGFSSSINSKINFDLRVWLAINANLISVKFKIGDHIPINQIIQNIYTNSFYLQKNCTKILDFFKEILNYP